MKKVLLYLMLVSFLSLVGCASQAFRPSDLEPSTAVVTEGKIKGNVKEEQIQSFKEKITLVFENLTDTVYYYGVDFTLEVELDDTWYQVPFDEDVAFIEIAMLLEGKAMNEEVIDLADYFDKLPAGNYRVIKHFQAEEQTITIAPTFEVK